MRSNATMRQSWQPRPSRTSRRGRLKAGARFSATKQDTRKEIDGTRLGCPLPCRPPKSASCCRPTIARAPLRTGRRSCGASGAVSVLPSEEPRPLDRWRDRVAHGSAARGPVYLNCGAAPLHRPNKPHALPIEQPRPALVRKAGASHLPRRLRARASASGRRREGHRASRRSRDRPSR